MSLAHKMPESRNNLNLLAARFKWFQAVARNTCALEPRYYFEMEACVNNRVTWKMNKGEMILSALKMGIIFSVHHPSVFSYATRTDNQEEHARNQ